MGTGIGIAGVIFSVDESSVINGVDFTFTRFVRWNDPVVAESNDGDRVAVPREGAVIQAISEQTIDLLTEQPLLIQGVRGDTAVYGDQTITYDVPGMLWQTADAGVTLQAVDLAAYVEGAGEVIVDRRGWGTIKGEIEVLDTVVGGPGDYIDLEAPHQVNSKVAQSPITQRGGTRKVQIVGRTPHAGTATLHLEDAGNLAQTLPTPEDTPGETALAVPTFTLAASVDNPLTVATATVTNATTLEEFGADVEWEYAVSVAEPVVPGTPFGPLLLGFGDTEIDTPAVPSGSTVWVRARSAIAATGERSAWSAWQDITLGPDDDGAGGTLPPIDLSATINVSTGQLDAAASGVAAIVKVYFAVGAAGGAAPTYAAVLAGASDSTVPFTTTSLATMAVGETRTVGAIGEDALGNRTILVTRTVTRGTPDAAGALSWKQVVRVATTAAGTLATSFENGDTVDGVVLATGDRILIKDQAAGAENGIYTVNASGAPTRSTDADAGSELVNAAVFVSEGTANADTMWVCTTNATIVVNTTALVFVRFGAREFAIAAQFTSAPQTIDVPAVDFPFSIIGWRSRLGVSGSAAFTVQSAASVTAAYADMVGAGTAPVVSGALGASDDTLDWDVVDIAANEVVEMGCATLTTATQASLTLRCVRT